MRIAVVPGTIAHACTIAREMREVSTADVERVGLDPNKAILDAMKRASMTWAGTIDGKLVCLGGVEQASILSDSAYLWLITTKAVEDHSFIFVRRSQMVVEALMEQYRMIYGMVDKDFARSIQWLKWLGFELDPPEGRFRTFSKSRKL